jgi:hypothetical protein
MKTGNFLNAGMLVLAIGLTSDVRAQGRGRDDHSGNGNQGKAQVSEHPTRGIPGENRGQDRNENPNRGHDRDFHADLGHDNRDRGNDHNRYDRDRQVDHNRNYGDDTRNRDDHNQRGHRNNTYRYDDRTGHNRYATYNYHHRGRPQWAPYYGYRYNTRYIYYQDYNVYYDCHRNVFIVWTGRNWMVTTRIPDYMYRIDFNRANVRGVEYWDDDFDFYLQRRRPTYVNLQVGW